MKESSEKAIKVNMSSGKMLMSNKMTKTFKVTQWNIDDADEFQEITAAQNPHEKEYSCVCDMRPNIGIGNGCEKTYKGRAHQALLTILWQNAWQ